MQQNATDLTSQQAAAIQAILEGRRYGEAASIAGVHRSTLYRWLQDNDAFVAQLNRGRAEIRHAHAAKLDLIAEAALQTVHAAIGSGDAKTAMDFLKALDCLVLRRIGPTSSAAVRTEREWSELSAKINAISD